jgi:integrase
VKVYKPSRNGKQSRFFYYDFILEGRRYQGSTKLADRRKAERWAEDLRGKIRCGEVDESGKPFKKAEIPALRDFAQRFIDHVQTRNAEKPKTIEFYAQQTARLLDFEPLASARLDAIDEALIEDFVQWRSQQTRRACATQTSKRESSAQAEMVVTAATVNRSLATLRKLLRLSQEWRLIDRVPRIRLLPGENNREFVLSHAEEPLYLNTAPQPLRDFAILDLDTGLRVGEALSLEWKDVHLVPANGAKFGYIKIRRGKSKNARRNVPLTERTRVMLEERKAQSSLAWVFAENGKGPMLVSSLDHLHAEVRKTVNMSSEFVLHSLRHTYGTRLGEGGADAFAIMRLMGHSSVTVSQRYVHPTPETLERAVERLQALNEQAAKRLPTSEVPEISTVAERTTTVSG